MARPRQPIDLLVVKGKKNLTKKEIEKRKEEEVKAHTDDIQPPKYLNKTQKDKFIQISEELDRIGIMSNLDCDALARYIQCEEHYHKYRKMVDKQVRAMKSDYHDSEIDTLAKLENLKDKAFKQCRNMASDLGLTISSRCKLVIPKTETPEDPHADMFGDGVSG